LACGSTDILGCEDRRQPFGRPGAFGWVVDTGERLELHAAGLVGEHPAEILPVAAHTDRGGADAAAEIEGEDLRVLVAAKLHRHQCKQHRLAGAGRPDDQCARHRRHEGKTGTGSSLRSCHKARGRTEMLVPFRPRPYC
jgi:hypothetical protein